MFFLSQHNVALIPNLLVNDKPFSHSRHKRLIVLVVGNAVELWQHAQYRRGCPFTFVTLKVPRAPHLLYDILHQRRNTLRDHSVESSRIFHIL